MPRTKPMTRHDVAEVRRLCQGMVWQCDLVKGCFPEGKKADDWPRPGPWPQVAQLKRLSMELTRALARIRGTGRF